MTTPDPVALRETLDRIDATPMVVRSNPKRLSDMTNIVLAARRWLDLIEGGKEVWWCEVHRCEVRPPDRARCALGEWMETYAGGEPPCNMVKRLLVSP